MMYTYCSCVGMHLYSLETIMHIGFLKYSNKLLTFIQVDSIPHVMKLAASPSLETAVMRDAAFAGYAFAQTALANRALVGAQCIVPAVAAGRNSGVCYSLTR
jgi:hypothetical protein